MTGIVIAPDNRKSLLLIVSERVQFTLDSIFAYYVGIMYLYYLGNALPIYLYLNNRIVHILIYLLYIYIYITL